MDAVLNFFKIILIIKIIFFFFTDSEAVKQR